MKVLVFADSHKNDALMKKAVEANPDAEIILHAGDGALDTQAFSGSGKLIYRVRGNCDGDIPLEDDEIVDIMGVKIFLTHGNHYKVSYFSEPLAKRAKKAGCAAAVFGHTHKALKKNEDGVLLFNPGTCNRSRSRDGFTSYGVLIIENSDIISAEIIPVN